MASDISKRVLMDVLESVKSNRAGPFERWSDAHATRKSLRLDADIALHFVNAYGGLGTLKALRSAGLEKVYVADMTEVVGAHRAHKALARIDFQNGLVRDQPILRRASSVGQAALIGCAVIGLWNAVQSKPDGPAQAETSPAEAAVEADTTEAEEVDEESSTSKQFRISSCEIYATLKVQLRCFDHVNSMVGQTIVASSDNRLARRQMSSAASAYSPSPECRNFVEGVEGLALGQVGMLLSEVSAGGPPANDDVVSGCASLYGDAVINYCGGAPGGCVPD